MVLRGLEVNLCFRRLRMSFCGANGASAPPPSCSLRCLDIKTTGFRRNLWLVLIIDICLRLTYFSSIHNTMMKNKIRVEKWFNADRYVYIYIDTHRYKYTFNYAAMNYQNWSIYSNINFSLFENQHPKHTVLIYKIDILIF